MNIKRINELTGDILNYQQKVERLESDIATLKEKGQKLSANMIVIIGDSKRFQQEFSMNASEVLVVLERKLSENKAVLEKFKSIYEEESNAQPA